MIYVDKEIDLEFLKKLIDFAFILQGRKITLWEYPDINCNHSYDLWKELRPFALEKQELEAVTVYDDDKDRFKKVNCYHFDHHIIEILVKKYDTLVEILDSISIYKENDKKWFFCTIFHEQMSLLRLSRDEVDKLKKSGISYSDTPPDKW